MFKYLRSYVTDMDIFGMSHMYLTPFEISSKKIDSVPYLYTMNDICFFTSGSEKQIYNISNNLIMRREVLK